VRPLADSTPRNNVQLRICCPELFRTRRTTPGSSSHVGYSEGNGLPQSRKRCLKACSSERKDGDTITEMRGERPEAEVLHRKKREKNAKMIEKRRRRRRRRRTEPWGRANKLLEEKKAPSTFFDSMALDRNTPTEWSMVYHDMTVTMVASWWWCCCSRPSTIWLGTNYILLLCRSALATQARIEVL